jgi:hypothetical protein
MNGDMSKIWDTRHIHKALPLNWKCCFEHFQKICLKHSTEARYLKSGTTELSLKLYWALPWFQFRCLPDVADEREGGVTL